MIKFKEITMRNFLSYGNSPTTVKLDQPGATLIIGDNGTGKTTIINALVYGLYGKPLSSDMKMDGLINDINGKDLEVSVEFEKNNTFYKITRRRKPTGTNRDKPLIEFLVNGVDETKSSIPLTNETVEGEIGISFELFIRIVVFSATHPAFFNLPVRHTTKPSQTGIMEELFDLTTISKKATALKLAIKDTSQKMDIIDAKVKQAEQEKQRHLAQVKSAEDRVINWEQQTTLKIQTAKSKLAKVKDIDFETEQKYRADRDEIMVELMIQKQKDREFSRAVQSLEGDIEKYETELQHLKDNKCPYCKQKYAGADTKAKIITTDVKEKRQKIDAIIKEWDKVSNRIQWLATEKAKIEGNIKVPNFDELIQIKSQTDAIEQELKMLESAENPFIEPLEELESITFNDAKEDEKELKELHVYSEHQKFLLQLLQKKDSFVRKSLLNKNISFLNTRLHQYITELNLPHTVQFTEELIADIHRYGLPVDPGNLSHGQKSRLNFALSLAFRDVLEAMHTPINVCLLDEVIDVGLDSVGVELAAELLKRKARDDQSIIYIISHRDEIAAAFPSVIRISLDKGFSVIES